MLEYMQVQLLLHILGWGMSRGPVMTGALGVLLDQEGLGESEHRGASRALLQRNKTPHRG